MGHTLAGTMGGEVWVWRTADRTLLSHVRGQQGGVYGVALSADGRLVASGGVDGTVRLWGTQTGTCLHTQRPDRPYERLDISGVTGITASQRAALVALGAVERAGEPTGSEQ